MCNPPWVFACFFGQLDARFGELPEMVVEIGRTGCFLGSSRPGV